MPRTFRLALGLLLCLTCGWQTAPAQDKGVAKGADSAAMHVGRGYDAEKDQRYQEAADEFQAALALDPSLTRARYQLGVCWVALGKAEEARTEFNRLLKETGGNPQVKYYLALLDLRAGNPGAAIAMLSPLVAHPPFPDAVYYLGAAYLEKNELPSAEKWLRIAAQADPQDSRVPDHLARVYQREGRKQEAERQFQISSELRHHLDEGTQQSVTCSQLLETEPLDQARPACEQLFDPNDSAKLMTLGMLYGQHGYFGEAVAPLEKASRLDPDSWEVYHDLGLTYFRLHRYPEARTALEKAVELRPDFFGSNALLGAALYTLGQDDAAYKALQHAHALNPGDHDTADLLFKEAMLLADKEAARQQYATALGYLKAAAALHPDDEQVRQKTAELSGRAAPTARQEK